MPEIVPKNKAPGIDFCGIDKKHYIVRSDLGCYMMSPNFNEGQDIQVFHLHNSCRGAAHYLAHQDGLFYIIKGDNYRRVTDMSEDKGSAVYSLHPNCRGGDHYFSAFGCFYIVFQKRGVYRRVKNMHEDTNAAEFTLHPKCKDGLYYWGVKDYYFFVKPVDEWGIQFYKCTNLHENLNADTYSFHRDIINFIPGGLAIARGPAFGKWEAIKTISNDSNTPIAWNKKITKKVGYNKQKMSSIEHNWNIALSASYSAGLLAEAIAKFQISLTAEYGGSSVNTDQEDWSEATEIEESLNVSLQPNEKMYIWQYQLGLGREPVLYCRDMKFTSDSNPPTDIPLPPSNK